MNDNILIKEDVFSYDKQFELYNYCISASYKYGESDTKNTIPTGMIHIFDNDSFIYKLLISEINTLFPYTLLMNVYRAYINCFSPLEFPYFHSDKNDINGPDITIIYYVGIEKYNIDDNGTTDFYINDKIIGILPIPNRLLLFDSKLIHRATSFRDRHRFTIVFKLKET